MTASFWTQFRLNCWKSIIVKSRKPILWLSEILWPVIIFTIAIGIHQTNPPNKRETCYFRGRANPSVGFVPFIQSFACNVKNTCYNMSNPYQDIPDYKDAKLDEFIVDAYPIYENDDILNMVTNFSTIIKLINGTASVFNDTLIAQILENRFPLENAFTNSSKIENYLTSNDSVGNGNALTKLEYDWIFRDTFINITALYFDSESNPIFSNHTHDKEFCESNFKSYIESFGIDERDAVLDRMAISLCDMSDAQFSELVEIVHKNLDVTSILTQIWHILFDLMEYDINAFERDIVRFLDVFITNIFFLSEEESDALEKILFEIVEIIVSFFNNLKGIEMSDNNINTFLNQFLDTHVIKYEHIKSLDLENIIGVIKSNIPHNILTEKLNSTYNTENITKRLKDAAKKILIRDFEKVNEEEKPKDIIQILQCWRPFHDVLNCSHNQELLEIVEYLKSVEEEFDLISTTVNSTYLSKDFAYNRIGLQHLVAKRYTDLLDTRSNNETEIIAKIKDELIKKGNLTTSSADVLLNTYLDVNRLNFINFRIPEEVYESSSSFARLFKLSDENISKYDDVRLDISFNGNKSEISKILTDKMDHERIARNLKRWRTQALYEFEWIVPLYETFVLIVSDFNSINTFTSGIMSWFNNNNYTSSSNVNLLHERRDSNSTIISIDSFFNSIYEIFDGFELFFGNRREIPFILSQVLSSFEQLNIFHLLMDTKLQFKLIEMFNGFLNSSSINSKFGWDPLAMFFQEEFHFSKAEIDIMAQLLVKLPKLLIFGEYSAATICDPDQLAPYLIIPTPSPDDDGAPNLETIDGKLCNMTILEKGALMPIVYDEFRFEDFLYLYLNIDINTILEASNVTQEEAEIAIEAMQDGYEAYKNLTDNFNGLFDLLSNASYEYGNLTWSEMASSFTCGQKDEFMIGNYNLDDIFDSLNGDNDYKVDKDNGNEYLRNSIKEASCEKFISTLNQTDTGVFLWGFIGHVVRGKILYAPIEDFESSIIQEANKTFLIIDENVARINALATIGPQLEALRTMKDDLDIIQELFQNSTIRQILEDAGMDEGLIDFIIQLDIDHLIEKLENTQEFYTTDLEVFTNFLACVSTKDRFMGVENEEIITEWAKNRTKIRGDDFFAGISFMNGENNTKHVKYKLKMEKGKHANTHQIRSPYYVAGPESGFLGNLGYLVGFMQLQEIVDRAVIETITGNRFSLKDNTNEIKTSEGHPLKTLLSNNQDVSRILDLENIGVMTQEFPFPCYEVDWFLNQVYLSNIFQIAVIFSYLAFIISNTRQQLWEKESQNADIMQAMGMQTRVIWLVWLVMCFINIFIITTVLVILFKYGPFLPRSNPIIVWMVFFVIGAALIAYCFMMCAIMSRTAIGSIVTAICYVCSFIPYVILLLMKTSLGDGFAFFSNLFVPSSMSGIILYMSQFEQEGSGLQWDNFFVSPNSLEIFSVGLAFFYLVFDMLVYGIVGVVVLVIKDLKAKERESLSKFFTKVANCWLISVDIGKEEKQDNDTSFESNSGNTEIISQKSQSIPINVGVHLEGLTKAYNISRNEERIAVSNLSLSFQIGEVTALLGHNGAGKSTTIKMITGMIKPSSGNAYILGNSVIDDRKSTAKHIGFCPQHSILYDCLTVNEHLKFYGRLKGEYDSDEMVSKEIQNLLDVMGMNEESDKPVSFLSEGMQRRVCVSLAFIGGSEVVILDEPTSGVDPIARRYIWNLIGAFKKERTIIFTTHHLDEAEVLSDKVAILHNGTLLAEGAVSQLKKTFDAGFHLIVKHKRDMIYNQTRSSEPQNSSFESLENDNQDIVNEDHVYNMLVTHVKSFVPKAKYLKADEVDNKDQPADPFNGLQDESLFSRFHLPYVSENKEEEDASLRSIQKLLASLDKDRQIKSDSSQSHPNSFKGRFNIDSYILDCTSLEQIFMSLLHMEDEKKNSTSVEQENENTIQEKLSGNVNHDAIAQNNLDENDETTPTVVKKLHRRQVSTASAKMFALNEEIFSGVENDYGNSNSDIPPVHVDQEQKENSKEVKFEGLKGDSGISRSMNRSDIDRTSDTQITSGIGTIETSFETIGTSRSSMNKGKRPDVKYSKLKGWNLTFSQINALLQKRFLHTVKDYKFLISSLILPCLMLAISMLLPVLSRHKEQQTIILSPSLYGPESSSFVNFKGSNHLNLFDDVLSSLTHNDPGIGTTCMEDFVSNNTLHEMSKFGALCASYDDIDYKYGFSQNYSDETPGKMMYNCECSISDDYNKYAVWSCLPKYDGVETPGRNLMQTKDILFNLTDLSNNASPNSSANNDWILDTHKDFIDSRYGGWSVASGSKDYLERVMGKPNNLISWYNNKGYHALPSYANALNNAILRAKVLHMTQIKGIADSSNECVECDYGISTFAEPMVIRQNVADPDVLEVISSYGIALIAMIAFSFVPASSIIYLIQERKNEEKQVQIMAGVSKATYWAAVFIWDLCVLGLFTIAAGLIIFVFGVEAYTSSSNFSGVILLAIMFCITSILIVYNIEKWFSDPSMGQVGALCIFVLIATMFLIIKMCMDLLWQYDTIAKINYYLSWFFALLPSFALASGLMDIANNQAFADLSRAFGVYDADKRPLSMEVLGPTLIIMSMEAIFLVALHILKELDYFQRFERYLINRAKRRENVDKNDDDYFARTNEHQIIDIEDEDVANERKRIAEDYYKELSNEDKDILQTYGLTKIFRSRTIRNLFGLRSENKIAVNNVSVGIKRGECFGWLGLNGAGKSTTFKMLTNIYVPTTGEFHVSFGFEQPHIGYCPQVDSLDPLITVEDLLQIYAKVKGIPKDNIQDEVKKALLDMDLYKYRSVKCRGLSGGTKRKVCTAIAFMGDPELILMDEPTSGMDALTKRLVWAQIQNKIYNSHHSTKQKVSIILTSHSMEECEVLCSRLAIMVDGNFQCLGSPTHIKQKFGRGYTVSLLFKNEKDLENGRKWVTETGSFSRYHENLSIHNTTISFRVFSNLSSGKRNIFSSPSIIFKNILEQKRCLKIQDFSVKHTTLDEVFVGFAKSKSEEDHDNGASKAFYDNKSYSNTEPVEVDFHDGNYVDSNSISSLPSTEINPTFVRSFRKSEVVNRTTGRYSKGDDEGIEDSSDNGDMTNDIDDSVVSVAENLECTRL